MRLVASADVRAADRAAASLGAPPATLMEAAGRAVAEAAQGLAPGARRPVILCGPGNNGGDGYVAALRLSDAGAEPIVLALDPDRSRGDAADAARRAWRARGTVAPLTEATLTEATLAEALALGDLAIDALFGTGLRRPLAGAAARVPGALATWGGPVLAVDVPSGVDADRAVAPGPHVRADRTVQLAFACLASALAPVRFAFGDAPVADIGVPEGALPTGDRPELVEDADAAAALPTPEPWAHKYQAGTVAIAAGSARWSGAAELACRGAHRAGAGLVTLATPAPFPSRWPETVVLPVADAPGELARTLAAIDARHAAAWVLGPGLAAGRAPELATVLAESDAPAVLDAGALDPRLRDVVRAHGGCWLTPHHGEAARLLGRSGGYVAADPVRAALDLADAWGAGVALKSAGAVVADVRGRVRIVAAGHPGMAAGGTGDVLAGMIGAALAAPGGDPLARVAAAVHLHARAGERAAATKGLGLRAGDLAEAVPEARRALGGAW